MEAALEFGLSLVGAPYSAWVPGTVAGWTNTAPFWCGPGPLPSVEQVQRDGTCCTGLLNLIMRVSGVGEVPERYGWVGDTSAWGTWLEERGVLRPLVVEELRQGDLLFRLWSPTDQGHVAICLGGGQAIHSYSGRGVVVEPWDSLGVDYYPWRVPAAEIWRT
jgi:cell wall-associated NlpC family hydrolase